MTYARAEASLEETIRQKLDQLNPNERRLAEIRLERIVKRRRAVREFRSPGHVAKYTNPDVVQTEMMVALDKAVIQAETGMQRRWVISTPPQEGKTMRLGTATPLWLLIRDPSRRIVVASYEQGLAARSALAVRQLIESYGGGYKGDRASARQEDHFGLLLDPDRAQQTNWQLADVPGRINGGMTAVGVGSSFTGRSADILIVDDAVKDPKAADSALQRQVLWNWWQAVATTRLAGKAIVIVIGTRWHEDDLLGRIIREDEKEPTPEWSRLNIPAQAGADDPLGRKPGEYLRSAREGREWVKIRRRVGERWWAAMYQGNPHPISGGVFKQEWFDRNRVKEAPELARVSVFVDPADNEGGGDEAGIVVAGKGYDEDHYILADRSGAMTAGRWLRVAFLAALEFNATEIAYEQSLSGLKRTARQTWKDMVREFRVLNKLYKPLPNTPRPKLPPVDLLTKAVTLLVRDDATATDRVNQEHNLIEMWPFVPAALELPAIGLPIRAFPARGSKTFRARMIAPTFEGDHVKLLGHFPEAEHQMITWQESQKSPDRMDVFVHAITEHSKIGGPVDMRAAKGGTTMRAAGSAAPKEYRGDSMRDVVRRMRTGR